MYFNRNGNVPDVARPFLSTILVVDPSPATMISLNLEPVLNVTHAGSILPIDNVVLFKKSHLNRGCRYIVE